jgi:hypothetical protein
LISVGKREALYMIGRKAGQIKVNSHQQKSNAPQEVYAKEPVDNPHEIYLALFSKKATKESLNSRIS